MTIPLSGEQRGFAARIAQLSAAAEFAQGFCDANGVDRRTALRLALVIEELFINTVRHGYRGDSEQPVWITLVADDAAIALLYEDAALRYDPLARATDAAVVGRNLDARPVGGLGIHLIGVLAESARYAHEHGRNRLWLRLRRSQAA